MDAKRLRANLARLGEGAELTPVAMWTFEGVNGRVMCLDCAIKRRGAASDDICSPCPGAWRENKAGGTEYWREPKHQLNERAVG